MHKLLNPHSLAIKGEKMKKFQAKKMRLAGLATKRIKKTQQSKLGGKNVYLGVVAILSK